MTNNPSVCTITHGSISCVCGNSLSGDGTFCASTCNQSACSGLSACSLAPQTCQPASCGYLPDGSYCTTSTYSGDIGTCAYDPGAGVSTCNSSPMGVCNLCACSIFNSISCENLPLFFNVSSIPAHVSYMKVDYTGYLAMTRSFIRSTVNITTYQFSFLAAPYISRKLLWNILNIPTLILSSIGLSDLPLTFFVGSKATFISLDDNLFNAIPPAIYVLNATLSAFSFGANRVNELTKGFATILTALRSLWVITDFL